VKIITIAGSDKIAIGAFLRFIRPLIGSGYPICDLHSLMTEESLKNVVTPYEGKKVLFTYYARKKVSDTPEGFIPACLSEISEVIVWFNLYATDFITIKDTSGFQSVFEGQWKKYNSIS
jgi:hypothetical protein